MHDRDRVICRSGIEALPPSSSRGESVRWRMAAPFKALAFWLKYARRDLLLEFEVGPGDPASPLPKAAQAWTAPSTACDVVKLRVMSLSIEWVKTTTAQIKIDTVEVRTLVIGPLPNVQALAAAVVFLLLVILATKPRKNRFSLFSSLFRAHPTLHSREGGPEKRYPRREYPLSPTPSSVWWSWLPTLRACLSLSSWKCRRRGGGGQLAGNSGWGRSLLVEAGAAVFKTGFDWKWVIWWGRWQRPTRPV